MTIERESARALERDRDRKRLLPDVSMCIHMGENMHTKGDIYAK